MELIVVDIGKEDQLYKDLAAGNDHDFAKHFAALAWEERSEYARDLQAKLDDNRSSHPELPELRLDIKPYLDYQGNRHEYVAEIDAIEERSWYNPLRWFGSKRTNFYEIYSIPTSEKIAHHVGRYLQTERPTK